MAQPYEELIARLREGAVLSSAAHLLNWDQETMMPPAAAPGRAEGLALLSRLAHERLTDPGLGELIAHCEANTTLTGDERIRSNLREIRRDFERSRRLPAELVAEINLTGSQAIEAWKQARQASDFALFRPWLEKQVALNRRKADCYGAPPGGEPYDALLEEFEPGMTAARLETVFGSVRRELVPLIAEISATDRSPNLASQQLAIPHSRQRELNLHVMQQVGLDVAASRLDTSAHPFSTGIAPGDTRITTRYGETCFADSLGSTLHEAGHALYEQGLPKREHWGQPLGEATSLGIHESQSRLWENHVGRSRPFWFWARPEARQRFGAPLEPFDADDLYRAVNVVRPGPIRVESDEATYNLHIMLRFDLERAMLRGDLSVAELPGAWNERMKNDLGVAVSDDASGCLQDPHWAMGAIAYFPTYTLGNLYAAQFWESLRSAISDLEDQLRQGEFGSVLGWLREKIHRHGRHHSAEELCRRATGDELSHEPLIRHLRTKYGEIYRLT